MGKTSKKNIEVWKIIIDTYGYENAQKVADVYPYVLQMYEHKQIRRVTLNQLGDISLVQTIGCNVDEQSEFLCLGLDGNVYSINNFSCFPANEEQIKFWDNHMRPINYFPIYLL